MSCTDPNSDFCDDAKPGNKVNLYIHDGDVNVRCPRCGDIPSFIHDEGHHDLNTVEPFEAKVTIGKNNQLMIHPNW